MINRIANSWELVKASWQVLLADKELILFPILSSIAVVLASAAFLIPMLTAGFFQALLGGRMEEAGLLTGAVAFLFYLVQYFIILFANSALVSAAMIRLEGGDPTLADGLQGAFDHIGAIFGYALIAATFGMILKALSRNREGLGRFVISLIGVAWNLVTYLVVPLLVVEGLGPIEAIKRSGQLLRRTWGEQIAGNVSITSIFGLAAIAVAVVVMAPAAYLAMNIHGLFALAGLAILVATFLAFGLLASTLNGIFSAALYRYAKTADPGHFFSPQLVQGAFRQEG